MNTGVKKLLILLAVMAIVAFGGYSLIDALLGPPIHPAAAIPVVVMFLVTGAALGVAAANRLVKD